MDRIRTTQLCPILLLLVCICHNSTGEPNTEVIPYSEKRISEEDSTVERTVQESYRHSRMYRRGHDDMSYHDDQDDHNDMGTDDHPHEHMKAMSEPKLDYWGGYYDFLINEGSYKFWAVFQLATAALLIYSGFAALYYAKINPPALDDEFDDILRRRRKRRTVPIVPRDEPFSGLDSATFQRIIDASARAQH